MLTSDKGKFSYRSVMMFLILLIVAEMLILMFYVAKPSEKIVLEAESMSRSNAAQLLPQGVIMAAEGKISGNVELPQRLLSEHDLYVAIVAKAAPVDPKQESYNVSYFLLNSSASQILNNPWEEGEISVQVAVVENGVRKESFEKWSYSKALTILRNASLERIPKLRPESMASAVKVGSFDDTGFSVEYRKHDDAAKWPVASIYAGKRYLGSIRVDSMNYENYLLVVPAKDLKPGKFSMILRFDNPYKGRSGETRKLYVDKIVISGVT